MKTYSDLLKSKNPIHELRKSGYKVKVKHARFVLDRADANDSIPTLVPEYELGEDRSSVLPNGGATMIELTTPEGKSYTGKCKCNQIDGFNRAIAARICLGRIRKQMEEEQANAA